MEKITVSKSIIRDYRFWTVLVCAGIFAVLGIFNLLKISIPAVQHGAASCAFIYLATALPFAIAFAAACFWHGRDRKLLIAGLLFAASFVIRILYADFQSNDYKTYLSVWMEEYRTLDLNDCFIKQVGNYPPLYNYFLIAFSRLNIYDLYLIKTLSFYCEVITAVFAAKLIAYVRDERFDFSKLALILLVPVFFTNSNQWAQCDTQYTMCAVAGIYFALKRRSVAAYIAIGLGLAFKMQTVLILPVGLVLLLAKNPEGKKYILWRYIWIVPVVFFAASCLPGFFGGSYLKVFDVYFNQVTVGNEDVGQALNGHCANILLPFSTIPKRSAAYYILLVLFVLITAAVDVTVIVYTLKSSQRVLDKHKVIFTCVILPFASVFFMPLMLDRFFYIAEMFMAVYLIVKRDKNTFTAFALLETAQWMMYTRALLNMPGVYVVSPLFSGFALIIVFAMFLQIFPQDKFRRINKLSALITL